MWGFLTPYQLGTQHFLYYMDIFDALLGGRLKEFQFIASWWDLDQLARVDIPGIVGRHLLHRESPELADRDGMPLLR